jgi:hypothetical protein
MARFSITSHPRRPHGAFWDVVAKAKANSDARSLFHPNWTAGFLVADDTPPA